MLFTGCSTHIPVQKEVGKLNLQNEHFQNDKATNHVIAIVSPVFAANDANAKAQNTTGMSRFEQLMAQRSGMNSSYNFSNAFVHEYSKQLASAFENTISEMLSSEGFKLAGPYGNFDDMTYRDKKKSYLAFVPKVDFKIEQKALHSENHRLYTHQDGVIQIGGSLIITMVEPMTGEVFMKKRINLSDFNIEEPYVYERQFTAGHGEIGDLGIGAALDKATAPKKLIDTTDVALTKALNEFYAKSIKKIKKYLDREEILSYERDVLKLKGLKRF